MLIDFNQYPDTELNCDICIVGGGAAGAVLFDILSKTKHKIFLIESGGLIPDGITQELNEGFHKLNGRKLGVDAPNPLSYRSRALGGTTGLWGGGIELFQELDFTKRSWVKDSGWPISLTELEAFYGEAKRYVEITADVFDERMWGVLGIRPPYKFNFSEISTAFSVKSGFLVESGYLNWPGPVNFRKYLINSNAQRSDNVVLYNATLTNLKSDVNGTVQSGEVSNSKLQKRLLHAKVYILAAGGLENPRIMLNANNGVGIGNETDCVGRYYLAHPHGRPADLICNSKSFATELSWKLQYYKVGNNRAEPLFEWKEATQRRYNLLSSSVRLVPDYDTDSAVFKAMRIREMISSGGLQSKDVSFSDVARVLSEIDDVLVNAYRKWTNQGVHARMMQNIPLAFIQEGTPKRHSRIYLSNERDKMGQRKLTLDWYFDDQEIQNMYKVLKLFAATARDLGWGRIQLRQEAEEKSLNPTRGLLEAAHPSGATRMSDDKNRGVVDRNLRVHSSKNLYVCGSSVFPTNSWVSPTFTIVALAARLAAHLKTHRL